MSPAPPQSNVTSGHDQHFYLIGLHPAISAKEYRLEKSSVIVGREVESADLVLHEEGVSRNHCRISLLLDEWFIEDLDSLNGTFLNGSKIKRERLHDGDVIGLAVAEAAHMRFQAQSSATQWARVKLKPAKIWKIGRDRANDLALGFDNSVSAVHASIAPGPDGALYLRDMDSSNGTFVDGKQLKTARITANTVVTIGSSQLKFALLEDGALEVKRKELGNSIGVECVHLTRLAGKKKLLDDITLSIKPGEFIGILGPSGAGKSTLLKALNASDPAQKGEVLYNELPLYPMFDAFRKVIGFVPQDDIVYPELTVKQSIQYAAKLRLPADIPSKEVADLIDSTIELLGLKRVADSPVKVLSGGQRKRVSIGCELIMRPGIFFLDEPTAGLDPSTEDRLMKYFKQLSLGGVTSLMTTHILYNLTLFDRVIILARGRLVFIGTPDEAMQHFGGLEPLKSTLKIFDILEGISSQDGGGEPSGDLMEIARQYEKRFKDSPLYQRHVLDVQTDTAKAAMVGHEVIAPFDLMAVWRSIWPPFSPREALVLALRNCALKLRSFQKLALCMIVPLVLGIATILPPPPDVPTLADKESDYEKIRDAFEQVPRAEWLINKLFNKTGDAVANVYNLENQGVHNFPIPVGTILMMVMAPIFMGTLTSCLELSGERPIYRRERLIGQRIPDYLASKVPAIFMLSALMTAVYLSICMIRPELHRLDIPSAALTIFSLTVVSSCLGLTISALDPTPGENSVMLAILVILPQLVLSGGLAPAFYDELGFVLKNVANLIPSRWGLEMMLTSAYGRGGWHTDAVRDDMGFQCGSGVLLNGVTMLFALSLGCLIITGVALKRADVKWRPQ